MRDVADPLPPDEQTAAPPSSPPRTRFRRSDAPRELLQPVKGRPNFVRYRDLVEVDVVEPGVCEAKQFVGVTFLRAHVDQLAAAHESAAHKRELEDELLELQAEVALAYAE